MLSRAGLCVAFEVPLPSSDRRPADIFVASGWGPRPLALDISAIRGGLHSEALAGAAAKAREVEKVTLYNPQCSAVGWDFLPLVVETTGAWGHRAQTFFNQLIRKGALETGEHRLVVASTFWSSVSLALVRCLAGMFLRSAPPPPPLPHACASTLVPRASVTEAAVEATGVAGPIAALPQHRAGPEPPVPATSTSKDELDVDPPQALIFVPPPARCRILVRLPSGSAFPLSVDLTDSAAAVKLRVLARCGLPPAAAEQFGLALGYAALDDHSSLHSADVQDGDTLVVFARGAAAPPLGGSS